MGIVIGAAIVLSTAGSAVRGGAEVAGKAATTVASTASDPMDAVLDAMLRPTVAQAPATPGTTQRPATSPPAGSDPRTELSRILASSVANGTMSPENRAYLAQIVAQRAGVSQEEAQKRVDAAFTAAREAADKARRAAILTGFVTAAALVISFAAAWWAAMKGGHHRDNSIPASFGFGAARRTPTPTR
jgi:hypothetical protein